MKWWMELKIVFGQNPLANDFATLVNDQFGSYKVYKSNRDPFCKIKLSCACYHA